MNKALIILLILNIVSIVFMFFYFLATQDIYNEYTYLQQTTSCSLEWHFLQLDFLCRFILIIVSIVLLSLVLSKVPKQTRLENN